MNKRKKINYLLLFPLMLLCLTSFALSQQYEGTTIDQRAIPVATVTDTNLIKFFLKEFMIAESHVTKIELMDATGNGFGERDLVKTYPSGEIYFIFPSDTVQRIMNYWKFQPNFQIVGGNRPPEDYEIIEDHKAEHHIFASLIRGLNRNYKDLPMKIRFERDSLGVIFEMWGYDPTSVEYHPPPSTGPSDVIYIFREDSLITERPMYDFICVYKTVTDTVFVGSATNKP